MEAICDRVIIINKGELVADDKLSTLQKGNKETHSVLVQFKEPVDKQALEQMREVVNVSQLQPSHFRIQTVNPEIVRKQILELALLHNLNIVSLQSEDQSLEDVFRSLTQKTE